jgi:hypothetical protein
MTPPVSRSDVTRCRCSASLRAPSARSWSAWGASLAALSQQADFDRHRNDQRRIDATSDTGLENFFGTDLPVLSDWGPEVDAAERESHEIRARTVVAGDLMAALAAARKAIEVRDAVLQDWDQVADLLARSSSPDEALAGAHWRAGLGLPFNLVADLLGARGAGEPLDRADRMLQARAQLAAAEQLPDGDATREMQQRWAGDALNWEFGVQDYQRLVAEREETERQQRAADQFAGLGFTATRIGHALANLAEAKRDLEARPDDLQGDVTVQRARNTIGPAQLWLSDAFALASKLHDERASGAVIARDDPRLSELDRMLDEASRRVRDLDGYGGYVSDAIFRAGDLPLEARGLAKAEFSGRLDDQAPERVGSSQTWQQRIDNLDRQIEASKAEFAANGLVQVWVAAEGPVPPEQNGANLVSVNGVPLVNRVGRWQRLILPAGKPISIKPNPAVHNVGLTEQRMVESNRRTAVTNPRTVVAPIPEDGTLYPVPPLQEDAVPGEGDVMLTTSFDYAPRSETRETAGTIPADGGWPSVTVRAKVTTSTDGGPQGGTNPRFNVHDVGMEYDDRGGEFSVGPAAVGYDATGGKLRLSLHVTITRHTGKPVYVPWPVSDYLYIGDSSLESRTVTVPLDE